MVDTGVFHGLRFWPVASVADELFYQVKTGVDAIIQNGGQIVDENVVDVESRMAIAFVISPEDSRLHMPFTIDANEPLNHHYDPTGPALLRDAFKPNETIPGLLPYQLVVTQAWVLACIEAGCTLDISVGWRQRQREEDSQMMSRPTKRRRSRQEVRPKDQGMFDRIVAFAHEWPYRSDPKYTIDSFHRYCENRLQKERKVPESLLPPSATTAARSFASLPSSLTHSLEADKVVDARALVRGPEPAVTTSSKRMPMSVAELWRVYRPLLSSRLPASMQAKLRPGRAEPNPLAGVRSGNVKLSLVLEDNIDDGAGMALSETRQSMAQTDPSSLRSNSPPADPTWLKDIRPLLAELLPIPVNTAGLVVPCPPTRARALAEKHLTSRAIFFRLLSQLCWQETEHSTMWVGEGRMKTFVLRPTYPTSASAAPDLSDSIHVRLFPTTDNAWDTATWRGVFICGFSSDVADWTAMCLGFRNRQQKAADAVTGVYSIVEEAHDERCLAQAWQSVFQQIMPEHNTAYSENVNAVRSTPTALEQTTVSRPREQEDRVLARSGIRELNGLHGLRENDSKVIVRTLHDPFDVMCRLYSLSKGQGVRSVAECADGASAEANYNMIGIVRTILG